MHGKRDRVTFTSPVGSIPPDSDLEKTSNNKSHVSSFGYLFPGELRFHAANRRPPLSPPDSFQSAGPFVQGSALFLYLPDEADSSGRSKGRRGVKQVTLRTSGRTAYFSSHS